MSGGEPRELEGITVAAFGDLFKAFRETMVREAVPRQGGLADRIGAHLEVDPSGLLVTSEEFEAYEQPNVQVALDDYLGQPGRTVEVLGVGIPQKRSFDLGLPDLVASVRDGRPAVDEGPIEYVNVHLAGDRVLGCV